jgi:hypothetical protein
MARGKDPHAVALGRKGASKGGRARAAALSPQERQVIARQGGLARWGKTMAKGEGESALAQAVGHERDAAAIDAVVGRATAPLLVELHRDPRRFLAEHLTPAQQLELARRLVNDPELGPKVRAIVRGKAKGT